MRRLWNNSVAFSAVISCDVTGVIVDVEATTAYRINEVNSAKTMIERVEQRFDLKPKRLIGDTAHGTAPMLRWLLEQKGIDPHIPVWDKAKRRIDESLRIRVRCGTRFLHRVQAPWLS